MAHEERYARPDQKPEETVHGEEEAPRTEHLSVGDIQRYTEELKAKVQAAQLQKEKDIEQKLTDRETLIAESRGNDALLNTAEEGLEYFTSVQELGLLTDPDDLRKLEDLKVLVDSLKEQSGEIEKKITAIAGQPEIFSKLYDAAEKKNRESDVQKEVERAHAEFDPQVDKLAHDIQNWGREKELILRLKDTQDTAQRSARQEINKIFDNARNTLKEGSPLKSVLNGISRKSNSPEEMKDLLVSARKSLGMFKGREKATIDFILSRVQEFEAWSKANKGLVAEEGGFQKVMDAESGMQEQFRTIILKAWEAQDKINELTGKDNEYNTLPRALQKRLDDALDKFAKIFVGYQGRQMQRDEYPGRTEAIRGNPVNRQIFDIWENIKGEGSTSPFGPTLVTNNPRKTRELE